MRPQRIFEDLHSERCLSYLFKEESREGGREGEPCSLEDEWKGFTRGNRFLMDFAFVAFHLLFSPMQQQHPTGLLKR